MKFLVILSTGITLATAQAQEVPRRRIISQPELVGSVTDREAVEHIIAYNRIDNLANARYTAGQSVTLQPGFVAQAGSVFKASIEVDSKKSVVSGSPEIKFVARAYPNPFQQTTKIEYTLPQAGHVSLTLVDEQGHMLQQEVSRQEAGRQEFDLTGAALTQGVYFYQIRFNNEQRTIRLVKNE